MNEIAANVTAAANADKDDVGRPFSGTQFALIGYGTLALAICVGWLLRDLRIVNPEEGFGYWLGIVGGSLMLTLLFYPAIKKSKTLQRLGWNRHWFRLHMILGLVGPLLILYHCNFQVHALNSAVALYSMLLVAGSGIVGRYFYARIHRGLYGERANIESLRAEMEESLQNSRGIGAILPEFVRELHSTSARLLGDKYTQKIRIGQSLAWTVKHYWVRFRLSLKIRRELRARSLVSDAIRGNAAELRRTANHYLARQVRLMRRIAQLAFYERLFSLWHLFHMPLFLLLVISALVHVLAVHMY